MLNENQLKLCVTANLAWF